MADDDVRIHVTPYGTAWAVRLANEAAPISVHPAAAEARSSAQRLAQQMLAEVVIFDEDWQPADHVRPDL